MTALAATVMFALATTLVAQTPPGSPSAQQSAQQLGETAREGHPHTERLQKLSKRERRTRIDKLEVRFQDFVADTEPIMPGTELDAFLTLETDAQRDAFVDDFWRRRDAMQGTTNRAFRDAYYTRLEVARQQFKKAGSDRARMFLLHGPPSSISRADCTRLLRPIEIWKYDRLPALGSSTRLLFYRPRGTGDYRLWNALGGSLAFAELLAQDSSAFADASDPAPRRGGNPASASPYSYINRIQLECSDGDEIARAITSMVQARIDLMKLFEPPQFSEEDPHHFLRSAVIPNPKAPKLSAEFSVRYPAKDGSRTAVQLMVLVPRKEVSPAQVGGADVYTIDVSGEVLRDGNLWERYRYRFDYPGDFEGETLPIIIDRFLRPADYGSRIKVTDANGGAEVIVESELAVPELFLPDAEAPGAPAPAVIATTDPGPAAKPEAPPEKPRLRIVPPPEEIVTGIHTVETVIHGSAIKGVEFSLDGRKIAVRRAPPFALALDFGTIPRARQIRAVGLDAEGRALTGDEVMVNTGTIPFRVRITSPRIAPHLVGQARVEMDVRIPDGEKLATLELFWNEMRLATLYDEPFVQTVEIPAVNGGVGYLRAVATLAGDPMPPVEDVVMINTPAHMEELEVHLVELPTTVIVKGKPASHLTEKDFKIQDEGKAVRLVRFEYVRNLPLSIGMAIDTSGSMRARMEEAQKAGAQFFEKTLRAGDKGFLVAFDTAPQVVQKWSSRVGDMHAGLARLRAEESTALYDAVVYSLYNFHGVRGQKALVLISDGKDTASKFTYDQTVEYARRAAVPIYAIGLGIRANEMDVRYKLSRLASETGGSVYYIEQASGLQKIYDEIQEELRSQYILGFYPASDVKPGSQWREVTVQASEGKVRTIKGYFP